MDRKDKIQRATMLVDILSRHCGNESFTAFRESLVEVGQKAVVHQFFARTDAGSRQTSGT